MNEIFIPPLVRHEGRKGGRKEGRTFSGWTVRNFEEKREKKK